MPTVCDRTSTSSAPIEGGSSSATTARSGASNTSAFICPSLLCSSVELHSAGDVDALTSHVPGAVRSQEGHRLAYVLGLLRATQRDRIDELLPGLLARDAPALRELI